MTAYKIILEEQRKRVSTRRWSENGEYRDYLAELTDNLLYDMQPEILDAFGKGAGSELPQDYDKAMKRHFRIVDGKEFSSKMQAIHSSSALVCNAFGYWYGEADRS